jgi:hypothetical protein
LYGKGTRIDLVSYIAFNPRASPSNISGPMRLACEKKIRINPTILSKQNPNHQYLHNSRTAVQKSFFFSTPVGLHKEGTRISIIALSGVNAATTNGPGPFDLRGLPFCKNPLPDWVIAQRRHCCGTRKQIIEAKQLGSSESGRCIVQRMYSESKMTRRS